MKNTIIAIGIFILIIFVAANYLIPQEVTMIKTNEDIKMYIVADRSWLASEDKVLN